MSVYTSNNFAPPPAADKGDRHLCSAPIPVCPLQPDRDTATCYSSIINRCLLQIRPVNPWEGNRGNYDVVIIIWTDLMMVFVKSLFLKVYKNGGKGSQNLCMNDCILPFNLYPDIYFQIEHYLESKRRSWRFDWQSGKSEVVRHGGHRCGMDG